MASKAIYKCDFDICLFFDISEQWKVEIVGSRRVRGQYFTRFLTEQELQCFLSVETRIASALTRV